MSVTWKPIPGHSLFEASSEGQVRRVAYPLFTKGPRQALPAIMRPYLSRTGYWDVSVCADNRGYVRQRVHRLVLLAFHGEPPEGKYLGCHIDGDKLNNRPENLYWGDHADNGADNRRLGEGFRYSQNPGSHPTAKLTEENVSWIKRRLLNGERVCDIADSHGVARSTISMIATGKNWAHIEVAQ